MTESLTLKWGTLKGWRVESKRSKELLKRYIDIGASMSCAMQKDTPEQKQILCDLVDAIDCEKIYLDWDGKYVTKDEAKKYILEYGRKEKATT